MLKPGNKILALKAYETNYQYELILTAAPQKMVEDR